MSLHLKEVFMPRPDTNDPLDERTQKILELHSSINADEHPEMTVETHKEELLSEFFERSTYIVDSTSEGIQAAAILIDTISDETATIESLSIASTARFQNIGSYLVAGLIEIARQQKKTTLHVRAVPSAVPFWHAQGFSPILPAIDIDNNVDMHRAI